MEANFIVNNLHKIVEASGDVKELTGLSPNEVLDKYCYDVLTSELCFRNCPYNYVIRNKKTFKKDSMKLYNEDGSFKEVSYIVSPELNDPEKVSIKLVKNGAGIKSDNDDVFSHSSMEKKLFPIILESVNDGVIIVDKDFRIIEFNKVAQELTGYKKEELYGQPCPNICSLSKSFSCPFDFCLKTNNTETKMHTIINRKNGDPIIVNLKLKLVFNELNELIYGIAILQQVLDIMPQESENFYGIIGRSKEMKLIQKSIKVASISNSPVLITGESGVGKELVASAIHKIRTSEKKPFIKINCAALPETLLESELFGYEKGAFTSANISKPGKFELAEEGTILLDEISETSKTFQAKLLRVIQEREFERLGGINPIKLKAHIIATTNKDLKLEIEKDNFRSDLFYRLSGFVINVPPLRERPEDIPVLAQHFLNEFIRNYNSKLNKKVIGFSEEALSMLQNYPWPGNVRELKNTIESIYFSIQEEKINITPEDLPDFLNEYKRNITKNHFPEREKILNALKSTGFDKTKTARLLGISRVTLWRKMILYNIKIEDLVK
ncbi:MAG: sigma 54-interacting transcriptional regulator [Proteobacteria bacterium]|nr:sigma 54-interacting transcriptional regulator [Pseudomonadota bacterium]